MSTPTPASLSRPIPSALAKAVSHAETSTELGSDYHRDLAIMWAQVAQAQEAHRTRREVRGLTDAVLRLTRALTEEVPDGE